MAFQVSPGVQVKEIDLTNVIPAVSSSIGAIVGAFSRGPIKQIVTVSSEDELTAIFGEPTNDNYITFMQAASFLKYGSTLRVVRAAGDTKNAVSDDTAGTTISIESFDDWENKWDKDNSDVYGPFVARLPGAAGNSIEVSVCPPSADAFATWAYASQFDSAPKTSNYAASRYDADANDEVHIIVVDKKGDITGTPGSILEKFAFVSVASNARNENGTTNYYKDIITAQSQYLYFMDHLPSTIITGAGLPILTDGSATPFGTSAEVATNYEFALGNDGEPGDVTTGNIITAMGLFDDPELVDINLFIAGVDADTDEAYTLVNAAIELTAKRKDIVAFLSPRIADATVPEVITWANGITSTSYAVSDSTAVKMYDKYNDVYRWVPANGHTAGLCAYTDGVADAWWSPAGFNRGQLLGVSKLRINPNRTQRDDLYKARINPIVSFPGEGTLLYGDKTMLSRPSAFDRINVRRLFILLEKAVANAAKYQLFEFNDEFTRAQFRNMVEPFLRDVKGRRGITDFLVVCDGTNNTGQVIDTNNFVADIYIKPARSINFITLNFIATRTGVEFSEIVGQ